MDGRSVQLRGGTSGPVCRAWRDSSLSASFLWSHIHVNLRAPSSEGLHSPQSQATEMVKELLMRFGKSHLHIHFHVSKGAHRELVEELLLMLGAESQRWVFMDMDIPTYANAILNGSSKSSENAVSPSLGTPPHRVRQMQF